MSFITREDMYAMIEGLLSAVWQAALGEKIPTPFARMAYTEAMERFGVDKPDTRFGIELVDLTKDFAQSSFRVFRSAVDTGGVVKAINAKGLAGATQGQIETLTETAKSFRRERAGVHQGRRRRMEVADRQILQRVRKEDADRKTQD